jgi:hypothetical protein
MRRVYRDNPGELKLTVIPRSERYDTLDPRWHEQVAELSAMLDRLGIVQRPPPPAGQKGLAESIKGFWGLV